MTGPLTGRRVLEIGGIGPIQHAAMLLADLGAEVVRIERPGTDLAETDHLLRGRTRVCADLKDSADRNALLDLVRNADVLLEAHRPGVMERLGLGPIDCARVNPALVYGRMTGYGQEGPRARDAGHDINFLSLTGVLHSLGPAAERPLPPLNLLGDFGGGSTYLVVGVLAALLEGERSGRGQVVDAAVVDGTAALAQMIWAWRANGTWTDDRAANLLDGAAPFYGTYRCADGRFLAVGCLEPEFYQAFVAGLGLDMANLPDRDDRGTWPALTALFSERIATRNRDDWAATFAGTDACVTPVVDFSEASAEPQIAARGTVVRLNGADQAAAAPRLSRSAGVAAHPARIANTLADLGRKWSPRPGVATPSFSDGHTTLAGAAANSLEKVEGARQ
jgi:alpha-methylacyl-CoA racemase